MTAAAPANVTVVPPRTRPRRATPVGGRLVLGGLALWYGLLEIRRAYTLTGYLLSWGLRVTSQVLFFGLLGRYVGGQTGARYLVVGTAVGLVLLETLLVVFGAVLERNLGTLAMLAATPSTPADVFVTRGLQFAVTAVCSATVTLVALPLLLGVDLPLRRTLLVLPALACIALACSAYAATLSAIVLRVPSATWLVINLGYLLVTTFSGVAVPVSYWPGWIECGHRGPADPARPRRRARDLRRSGTEPGDRPAGDRARRRGRLGRRRAAGVPAEHRGDAPQRAAGPADMTTLRADTTARRTGEALALGYVDRLVASGLAPAELVGGTAEQLELQFHYTGQYLANPVFLGAGQTRELALGLGELYDAALGVVDWGFGGDLDAAARRLGLSPAQTDCVRRSVDAAPEPYPRFARFDLMRTDDGFSVLELNTTTGSGGVENRYVAAGMLAHQLLADFAAEHRLHDVDTLSCLIETLRAADLGLDAPDGLLALVDWPDSYVMHAPMLRQLAGFLTDLGHPAVACHAGELRRRNHRLWLYGERRPVTGVLRCFALEDIDSDAAADLVRPLLQVAAEGRVRLYAPLHADLYGSKGVLALLSANGREGFGPDSALSLPWSRYLNGELDHPELGRAPARDIARAGQSQLVLKQALSSGGTGVVAGWTVSPEEWRDRVDKALGGPYLLQQRVRPRPEPVLEEPGRRGVRYLNWGVFLFAADLGQHGYGGCWVRATDRPDHGVLSLFRGAQMGCALTEADEEDEETPYA